MAGESPRGALDRRAGRFYLFGMIPESLTDAFQQHFGQPAQGAAQAPGRVNLIGEHTDYNDGFVLPIAIERKTWALWAPREDGKVHLASLQADAPAELDLDDSVEPGEPAWTNYPRGVLAGLIEAGVPVGGVNLLFDSDVPIGGGLSSSASLEVATARALLDAAGQPEAIAGLDLARLCQRAEHEFAGTPCGIMDQAIAILAQADRALLLDCRSGEPTQVPFDNPDVVLLVADTRVKHDLTDGGYAARRQQCYEAAEMLGLPSLRDATTDDLKQAMKDGALSGKHLMRARHVVGEIERTLRAVRSLEARDYEAFGQLMYASHHSLRDDYEVSCDELDMIVDLARGLDGVYGARMTGGGFGGCAIVLVAATHAEDVSGAIHAGFEGRFGHACGIFTTRAAEGAASLT